MTADVGTLRYTLEADDVKYRRDILRAQKATKASVDKMSRDWKRGAGQIQKQTRDIGYAFNKLRRAAQVMASAFIFVAGIKQLGRLVTGIEAAEESLVNMQMRFEQFSKAPAAFEGIYRLSRRLGVSLEESAQGMTRLLIATKKIGSSQAELEKVYQNIVILGRAGGTSAEEMKGAMIQLSQGMASGRLQGEELRSVLENFPLVAMEIAKELDTDIGKIRELAAEGKITTAVIVKALSSIQLKLEDLPKTFSQSMARMKNEWTLFKAHIGKSVDSGGFLDVLALKLAMLRFGLGDTSTTKKSSETLRSELASYERYVLILEKFQRLGKSAGLASQRVQTAGDIDFLGFDPKERSPQEIANTLEVYRRVVRKLRADLKGVVKEEIEKTPIDFIDMTQLPGMRGQGIPEGFQNFIKQFRTADQDIIKVEAELARLKEHIIAEFGEAEFDRIAASVAELWNEGLEEIPLSSLPKMKNASKETFEEMSQYAKQAARNIQSHFADFLFDPFEDGLKGMLQGFLDVIRRMIAEAAAAQFFGGNGPGGKFLSFLGLGERAMGGPVTAGTPYLVGERGPEIMVPGSSGNIIPNHKLGGVTQNYYFEAGADVATIEARIIPMLQRTEDNSVSRVLQMKGEGRL